VLDPFYDTGDELHAAWHDPVDTDEQSRRFADQVALLVRAAPLLSSGTAVMAPDHLPGISCSGVSSWCICDNVR